MDTTDEIRLDELPLHQCGRVSHVTAADDNLERLMGMGVCIGRIVELVQRGDPLILKVYGTRLGVSARLASRVLVTPCQRGSCTTDTE